MRLAILWGIIINDVFSSVDLILLLVLLIYSKIDLGRGKKYISELVSSNYLSYINGKFTVLLLSTSLFFRY